MSDLNLKQVDSILDEFSKSWGKIVVLFGLVSAGVAKLFEYVGTQSWLEIGLVLFIVLIVALVVFKRLQQQKIKDKRENLIENSGAAFRGLLPFEEADSQTFFGRETDIGEILLMVRSSDFRFGVLTGESGCGKTSLLRAGLIPKLLEESYLPVYLRLYGDPEQQIRQAVVKHFGVSSNAEVPLQSYLQRICQEKNQTLVLCCDQFEEFFINHPDTAFRQEFIDFVSHCYHDQNLAVKFLFSLRQDFLVKISEFDGSIPEPLSINKRYHLLNFDSTQTETIIQRSVENAGLPFESGLCNTIAQDLVKENQVLPAELQIVCQQLQRQRIYSSEQYTDSGGKESLVYAFLQDVIKGAGREKDVKLVLRSMISEEGTKLTQTLADIARNSQQCEKQVESILHHFVNARLIREIQNQTPWHYELMHEYLISKINAISGGVMGAVKRANHIFKQWLNRYQRDSKTLISLEDSRFIHRYSDMDRNGEAGELLAKSLHRGWLNVGLLTVFSLVLIFLAGWFIYELRNESYRNSHDIGTLLVHNETGAKLFLQRIQHYGKKDDKPEMITLDRAEMYLEGPAYYRLRAEIKDANKKDLNWSYPVFIMDEDTSVTVTIKLPQDHDEMAYISAGTFRMGDKNADAEGGPGKNAPAHDVYLDAFQIGKTEVSNQDYAKFIVAKGYETTSLWEDKNGTSKAGLEYLADKEVKQPQYWNKKKYNQDDHPVVGVSWFEARAYCRWNGKELPTEAQWEKAARGLEGYEWSFGNDWDETKTNSYRSEKDGYAETAPVTAYQVNSYGLYNMSGNVWEWVQDAYQADFYTSSTGQEANPVNNSAGGMSRVLRGGSWVNDYARYLRASYRNWFNPYSRSNDIGFRCARTL